MKTIALLSFCTIGLCACELETKPQDFKPAVLRKEPTPAKTIVNVPTKLSLPKQVKKKISQTTQPPVKPTKPADQKKALAAAKHKARFEPQQEGYINAIQVYPFTKGALYKLYTSVNQISDIALQPGEQLTSVSAGDTARWIVGDTASGSGKTQQTHILVKPIAPNLETNLVINTDKRTYFLELSSQQSAAMSSVSWTYPDDDLLALKRKTQQANHIAANTIAQGVRLKHLNFGYRIRGDAPWKPLRVFDDGKKVYIQFPKGLSRTEAPPLFVHSASGHPALVNYRVKGTYYIVDRLFNHAELRLGEEPQTIIKLTRGHTENRDEEPW